MRGKTTIYYGGGSIDDTTPTHLIEVTIEASGYQWSPAGSHISSTWEMTVFISAASIPRARRGRTHAARTQRVTATLLRRCARHESGPQQAYS